MNGRTKSNQQQVMALVGVTLAAAGLLSGCTGYASFPPVKSATLATTNPNTPPTDELMVEALDWVTKRYPPRTAGAPVAGEPRLIINLPYGVYRTTYERIASKITIPAVPLTRENQDTLPIYHVSRVWVRGGDAKVDVLRPLQEVGIAPGQPQAYQQITVFCSGHLKPWHVERFQAWEIGVAPAPEYNYLPSSEWPEPETPTYRAAPPVDPASERVAEPAEPSGDSSGAPAVQPANDGEG